MEKRRFCSIYDHPTRVLSVNSEPSLTLQQAADECDINMIVDRYARTGSWSSTGVPPRGGSPSFGDFSSVSDFMSAQNALIDAQFAFDSLPAKVRKRFDNDPASLLTFLDNPSNLSEAIDLGLVNPSESIVSAVSPVSEA